MAGEAARLASKQWAPHLLKTVGTDISNIRSGQLADAIENGDKSIEDLVRGRARMVGIALSNMVDFINPEIVLLGGGLVEAMPDLIRKEVKTGIEEHATPEALDGLQVVVAKLKGHAVTTGAAKLALDVFGSNQHVAATPETKSKATS
jgi:glucokinase